jgi:hypothetical protein
MKNYFKSKTFIVCLIIAIILVINRYMDYKREKELVRDQYLKSDTVYQTLLAEIMEIAQKSSLVDEKIEEIGKKGLPIPHILLKQKEDLIKLGALKLKQLEEREKEVLRQLEQKRKGLERLMEGDN